MNDIIKTICKTVALTLFSVIIVVAFVLLLLSFVVPSAMGRFTGDLGMHDQSAWFYAQQYGNGKGNVEYIARAVEQASYVDDNYKKVVEYGEKLLQDERFATYAAQWVEIRVAADPNYVITENYGQMIYGKIGVAYYAEGEKTKALEVVFSVNQTEFDKFNAVTDLVFEVILSGDKAFASDILRELTSLQASGNVHDAVNLQNMIKCLTDFTA
ncbi:MAG: hypothetical protein J6Z36_00655 [Clostridia bacterium]|nr:hypothetical protein [Clostridia bacterium]